MLHASFWRRPAILVACVLLMTMSSLLSMSPQTVFAQSSTVSINPTQGPAGTQVTGTGSNWTAGDQIQISWADAGSILGNTTVQSNSTFTVGFKIPTNAGQGEHNIYFTDLTSRYFLVSVFTVPLPVTVQQVFTADSNNNAWTAFASGDPIHYMVQVKNPNSFEVTATFTFLAIGPQKIFSWSGPGSVPPGTPGYYSPSTVPTNAPAGTYKLKVTVTLNSVSSSGQSQFTLATRIYVAGNYGGKTGFVTTGSFNEPDGSQYVNYCGPGASQVLISAWTSNVPDIETLASQEKTNQGKVGTYLQDMVGPINSAIGQNYYSVNYASSQGDFSNMIGRDILDNHHPLITGIKTQGNGYTLNGWDHAADHIITIYGFDFRSPSVGYIYYYETSRKDAGTKATGPNHIDYKVFWSLVTLNKIQLS